MAIQQTKRQSDLEKRLALLRRQVYGKGSESRYISKSVGQSINESETPTHRYTDTPNRRTTETLTSSDTTYLRQDLLKIAALSSIAIGAQVILFFLSKNHILRLNLF